MVSGKKGGYAEVKPEAVGNFFSLAGEEAVTGVLFGVPDLDWFGHIEKNHLSITKEDLCIAADEVSNFTQCLEAVTRLLG